MSPEDSRFDQVFPEETMAIASAIAARSAVEEMRLMGIFAEIQGQALPELPAQVANERQIGRTILLMARVDDPSIPVTFKDSLDATHLVSGYDHIAKQVSEDGFVIEETAIRDFLQATQDEFQSNTGMTGEDTARLFSSKLAAAREVASTHGVTVAEVYADDALNSEADRAAFTIEEVTEMYEKLVTSFTTEMMYKVLLQSIEKLIPKDILEEISPEEINELALEMQLDPNLQDQFATIAADLGEAVKQSYVYEVITTWGHEELTRFTQQYGDSLTPQKALTTPVLELYL